MNTLTIKSIEKLTHDVLQIRTNKPSDLTFKPGQATEIAIKEEGWEKEGRPFTFTSLPEEKDLEFVIKTYTDHDGVTNKLLDLREGDKLLQTDVFGSIHFKGEGTFIAGGAGLTPLISIIRDRENKGESVNNQLFFANKTQEDIILKDELEDRLGDNFVNVLSQEKTDDYSYGRIDQSFLKEHITNLDQKFYICGPDKMTESVANDLMSIGVEKDNIVAEGW